VILRFADELSLSEIAESLGIPLGTVKSRLHGALARLRRKPG
jgi:RNA polymerase sigma-70 factor (ECF subfamily)